MLIPARTDTAYFHDYIYGRYEIRFLRGRLHFNESKTGAPFPSMVVIMKKTCGNALISRTNKLSVIARADGEQPKAENIETELEDELDDLDDF